MRIKTTIAIGCCLISLIGCQKETPKQSWQRAAGILRQVDKLYLTLSKSFGASGESRKDSLTYDPQGKNPENQKTLTYMLMAYGAAFNAKKSLETADKLETFAQFESPTQEQFAGVVKDVDELLKSAETSTTNPIQTGAMRPDERRAFIQIHEWMKEVNEIVNKAQPTIQN